MWCRDSASKDVPCIRSRSSLEYKKTRHGCFVKWLSRKLEYEKAQGVLRKNKTPDCGDKHFCHGRNVSWPRRSFGRRLMLALYISPMAVNQNAKKISIHGARFEGRKKDNFLGPNLYQDSSDRWV